jgi:polysaccharide chain length determinant protein (PEP-CTERM system associated)
MAKQLEGIDVNVNVIGPGENSTVSDLQRKLNHLLLNYTEGYPEVIKVRAEIKALKHGYGSENEKSGASQGLSAEMLSQNPVYQDLKAELVKVESDLAAMTARENHLKQVVESKKEYLRDIPAEKKKLLDMERQRETNRQIYEELILRHGQSEVSKQMEIQDKGATFNIVDPAVLPTKPVSPNRVMIILMGIAAGLAGAFGIIFLMDNMDTSIKTVDALKTLGLPVLAVIPAMSNPEDLNRARKSDILLYSFAGVYVLLVLMILGLEFLGVTYVDQFVTKFIMRLNL